MSEHYTRVASLADLPAGKTLLIEHGEREVLLCHTGEGVFAVDNLCTHGAARLCEGRLRGNRILCPLHGAAFDVRDGSVLSRPAREALPTWEVRVDGDDILLGASP